MAYTRSVGMDPPLVFLHGTGCASTDWDATIESLPAGLHWVSLDFRGHGSSQVPETEFTLRDLADDVAALVDLLRLAQPVLVGHSLGGMVALDLAARSSQIAGLVLLEGWTSLCSSTAFGDGRFYGRLSRSVVAQIQHKYAATRARFRPQLWESFWQSVQRFDAFSYLGRARIPILQVYGEMGRNAETEQRLQVPANPHIEWVWIADAGHYLPHERPAEVAEACLRGLERVRDERPAR